MTGHGTLDVGVVGVGVMGARHARVYSELPDVRLIGVFDPDSSQAIETVRSYGGHAYGSLHDLLRSVDAVSIASPTSTHVDVALDAIDHGCHFLIEKPLADSIHSSKRIIERAARSRDRIFMVGHIERFNPTVMALRKFLGGQRIVSMTLRRMSQFSNRALDTDVVHDLMIHDIDLTLMLLGDDVSSIDAIGTPVRTPHIDQAMAEMIIGDAEVHLIASRVANRRTRTVEVRTENARITADLIGQTIRVNRGPLGGSNGANDGTSRWLPVADGEPLTLELQQFVQCATSKSQPELDLAAGYRAMGIAACINDLIARSSGTRHAANVAD